MFRFVFSHTTNMLLLRSLYDFCLFALHGPCRKHRFQQLFYCYVCKSVAETCLQSHFLAAAFSSGSTISSFRRHFCRFLRAQDACSIFAHMNSRFPCWSGM
jgi:hypothetical protein